MKGRKFTRRQLIHARKVLGNPQDWLLLSVDEYSWTVVHRFVGQVKQVRSEKWAV